MAVHKSTKHKCKQIRKWKKSRLENYTGELASTIRDVCEQFLDSGEDENADVKFLCDYAYDKRREHEHEQRSSKRQEVYQDQCTTGYQARSCAMEGVDQTNVLRDLLCKSAKRFATKPQSHALRLSYELNQKASKRIAKVGRSSVANIAKKINRGSVHAIAGVPFMPAIGEGDINLLFSEEFAAYTPYCPEVLTCFDRHTRELKADARAKRFCLKNLDSTFTEIWTKADSLLQNTFRNSHDPCKDFRMGLAALAMLMSSRWLGAKHNDLFRDAYKDWKKIGMLNDMQLRRQLLSVGGYFGESALQLDFLKQDDAVNVELAAAALFMIGKKCGPVGMSALVGSTPSTVIAAVMTKNHNAFNQIIDYVEGYVSRSPYRNTGTPIMMMRWAQAALHYRSYLDDRRISKLARAFAKDETCWSQEPDLKMEFENTFAAIQHNM